MKFGAASAFVYTLALVKLASAHVSIINPCPRYSPVGEKCPALPPGESYDTGEHAINGPISSVQLGGTMPLCRHTTPWPTPAAKWTAGEQVTIKFNPSAAIHSGGHCQFSMSYDNGKTFAVIHEELQYCFLGSKPASLTNTPTIHEYSFTLPKDLPSSDKAVFSWTWINASGNREFYMNCADVAISGSSSSSYTGKQMVIANYPGYPTIPEFNGDYDTGMQYYKDAPSVTISPSGGGGGSSGGNYANSTSSAAPSSAAPSSAAPEPTTATAAGAEYSTAAATDAESTTTAAAADAEPTYTASSAPASSQQTSAPVDSPNPHDAQDEVTSNAGAGAPAASGGGSCSAGQMQCSGNGYKVCIGGNWSQEFACGTGTTCKGSDNSIYCGFS